MKLVIDFESYYDSKTYTLNQKSKGGLSIVAYVRDPRFKVWGLGFAWIDDKNKLSAAKWVTGADIPAFFKTVDWTTTDVIAHNAKFDGFIIRQVYGVQPRRWIDTKGMSRAVWGKRLKDHSLATIAAQYGLAPKGVMRTDGLTELTLAQEVELSEYCLHDVELGGQIYLQLANKFPESQYEMLHWTVQMFANPKLVLATDILTKTAEYERARQATIFSDLQIDKKVFSSNKKFPALLEAEGFEVPMKPSPKQKNEDGTPKLIPAIALGDTDFLEMMESDNERLASLCEARVAAKSTLLVTRSEKLAKLGATGLWPFDVEFSGANQTHRFSGGKGAGGNPQNFQRCQDPKEHKIGHECKGRLRASVCAPPGHKLIVGDFSAVEFRLVAYLSKDPGLIDLIENDIDPYCAFASMYYGRTITKNDDAERRFGKEAQLGLGYGMGWEKFQKRIKIKLGKDISEKEARDAVELYRTRYSQVQQTWYVLNSCIPLLAEEREGLLIGLPIRYRKEALVLPSGLEMQYPNLRKEEGERGLEWVYDIWDKGQYVRRKLYGGKVLENISQGLAGELCKEAAQQFGDKITGLVHDEIHLLEKTFFAPFTKRRLEHAMTATPDWMPRLKLGAEVGMGDSWFGAK